MRSRFASINDAPIGDTDRIITRDSAGVLTIIPG
jgi:hypothetical protein